MSSSVWVLCPNGHRVNVSCGSNTPLNTIKQQACDKQGFNPAMYGLRKEDMKKGLDLSLPFRLSGLANKAKLELFEETQKSVNVNVALQLDTGGRVMGQVSNTSTIAQTIQSVGTDVASASLAIYLQRRIGSEDFGKTTLLDLGVFKGSVMLRLQGVMLKSTKTPSVTENDPQNSPSPSSNQPKSDIKPEQVLEEDSSAMSVQEQGSQESQDNALSGVPKHSVSDMEVDESPLERLDSEIEPVVIQQTKSFDSSPILFDPAAIDIDSQKEESDDFYVVTDRDLKSMLRDLHKISEREFRFREPEKDKDIPDNIVMRIRFPNGLMLQSVFAPKTSTTDSLYSFVCDYLTEESTDHVTLYQAPPKRIIKRGVTLQDAGLTSTTLLHAGGNITLKSDLVVHRDSSSAVEQLSGVVGRPEPTTRREEKTVSTPATQSSKTLNGDSTSGGGSSSKGGKAVPKWVPMLQQSYSSDSSDNEEDFLEEENQEEEQFLCLFCGMVFTSTDSLMAHCLKAHSVNLVQALGSLSFYGAIKTINYMRANKCTVEEFTEVLKGAEQLGDEYMKPHKSDDSLLMIDFEELYGKNEASECSYNGVKDQSSSKVEFLQSQLAKLQQAYMDLLEQKNSQTAPQKPALDHYFNSYATYTIHAEMLQDRIRTEAYRDYIYNNKELFSDKDVLDVGCGTGILSMFCAKGGARAVIAVDNSKIVNKAKSIIKSNNLASKINVFEGKIEEIPLDRKFDILISEWMGYGLLFECMLDSIIIARDKYLKPGGLVVPNRASMFITAVSDEASYHKRFSYWNNVYGFKMSEMIPELYSEAVVEVVGKDTVISDHCGFKHLDLCTVKVSELEFSRPFQLQMKSSSTLTSFVIHFRCFFDGDFSIVLDTSPECPTTHWLQTSLYLKSPVEVAEGDIVTGTVSFNKNSDVKRGYIIKLEGMVKRESTEITKFDHQFYLH